VKKLAEADSEEILRKTLEDAKAGNANARKVGLDRVWPIRKGRNMRILEPPIPCADLGSRFRSKSN
jgi:hypothetical protein